MTDIKTVQHEAKNSSSQPQAERDGREKILRTASEREEKKKLEDLICFLFVNWKKKNKKL